MRNLFKVFVPVAAAAIALVSCQVEIENIQAPGEVTIRVHATADELNAGDPETKTYLGTANTILWGTGEYMKLAVTAGETTHFATSSEANANGEPEATFEFTVDDFEGTPSSFTYQGIYPASAAVASSNTNPASYKVNLLSTQNATASSYDPAAYIMVAKPETFTSIESDWKASYRRATALNKITLKNVPSGVSIKRVEITAPDGKYLAGARHFNLSAGTSGDIYNGGGRTEKVEVKFATPLAGGSNIDVWFTSWGVEVAAGETLTIVAYTTDKKSYTKTITVPSGKSILFQEGYLNTLGANMSGLSPVDVTELEEGNYVILAKDGDNYYALRAEIESGKQRLLSEPYTGSLSSYLGDADLIWSATKSGDSFIFENSSKYLGYKGSDNESYWLEADENWTETNYLLDVTAQQTAGLYYVTLHSNSARYLSKNSSGAFFAFYGNTGQKADIVFVPATVDTRTGVTLSFDEDIINLTTANYDSFLGQDVTASPNVTAITEHLVWNKVDNDSVIDDFDEGVLTLTGNEGSATVTVSFEGDSNYRPASASYTINVASSSSIILTSSDITAGANTVEGTENNLLAYRLGTSSNNGSVTFEAGYSTITFKLEPYSNTPRTFSVTNGTINGESSLSPSAGAPSGTINAGFSRTDTGTEYTIVVTDPTQEVVFSGRRGIVWGFTATAAGPATTWNLESISITTAPDKTTYTAGESFDPTGMVVTGHFVDADDPTNEKDEAVTGYTITPSGALSTSDDHVTITYQGQTANQAITVSAAPVVTYDFEDIATLNGLTATAGSYSGYLTDAVVSFVNGSTAIIKDATGSALVYKSGHGLLQGQTYTGEVNVTSSFYQGNAQITAIDAVFTGSETPVAPESVALSALAGHYSDYQNAYVSVAGLTVTSLDGTNNKNIHVTDGTNTYVVFYNPGNPSCGVDDVITAVGTITKYNTTEEIKVWAAADITVTGSAPKAVTFTQPTGAAATAGCSIAVTVGGNPHTSGNTVASGTTVTLTATEGTDYEFTSWSVTGASVADASASTTTFVMGSSAVSISANFTSTGGNQQTPTLQYTLTPAATGGNSSPHNSYTAAATTTIDGIGWSVMGNSSMTPWRIGGKNITGVNRPIYSTTAISANISQIVITHGAASSITVNSMTVYVCSTAAGAAADTPTNVVASFTPTFVANGDVTINKADNTSWANCFYRIVYNVTVTGTSNKFVSFDEVKFYGTN